MTDTRAPHVSLLAGIIFDGHGRRMTPSHTCKGKVRYRYYVTHDSQVQEGDPPAWRLPAPDLEAIVMERMRQLFEDRHAVHALIDMDHCEAGHMAAALDAAAKVAMSIATSNQRRHLVINLVSRVTVEEDHVCITLDPELLARRLRLPTHSITEPVDLSAPAAKSRRGNETRLIITNQRDAAPARDDKLVALLLDAQAARDLFIDNPALTIAAHARATGQCRKRLARLVRLSWLAPDIVKAITEGRQPPQLNIKALLALDLPQRWSDQACQLGFA